MKEGDRVRAKGGEDQMRVGSTVTFIHGTPGTDEAITIAAIVTGIHSDGSLQLFAFRHDSTQLVYSMPRDRCEEVIDEGLQRVILTLREDIDRLEQQLEELTSPTPTNA